MRRGEFIALMGASVAWPFAALAQQAGRTYRLGVLHVIPRSAPPHVTFFDALRQLGFIEGQNLWVDPRGYGLPVEQLAAHASELAKAQVDVILCVGDVAIRSAQQATKTIPILAGADDLVGSGLVSSFAKPDGNTTGVSILSAELNGKRQEILMEAVPAARRMAAFADANVTSPQQLQQLQEEARARGVELSIFRVTNFEEIAGAIDMAKGAGAQAVNVLGSPFFNYNRQIIMKHVATQRLPAMYQFPETAEEGGFIAYGPRLLQLYRDILPRQLVQALSWRQARRYPGRAADQIRTGNQSQDR